MTGCASKDALLCLAKHDVAYAAACPGSRKVLQPSAALPPRCQCLRQQVSLRLWLVVALNAIQKHEQKIYTENTSFTSGARYNCQGIADAREVSYEATGDAALPRRRTAYMLWQCQVNQSIQCTINLDGTHVLPWLHRDD